MAFLLWMRLEEAPRLLLALLLQPSQGFIAPLQHPLVVLALLSPGG